MSNHPATAAPWAPCFEALTVSTRGAAPADLGPLELPLFISLPRAERLEILTSIDWSLNPPWPIPVVFLHPSALGRQPSSLEIEAAGQLARVSRCHFLKETKE